MNIPGFSVQLDLDGLAWRATRIPGVQWYPIVDNHTAAPDTAGVRDSVVLIRMAPGTGYPAHRHVGIEDVLILVGGYQDEFGVHGPGSFVRYPAGSVHRPIALGDFDSAAIGDPQRARDEENSACVMFAIARGGVENIDTGPDRTPHART
jgi:quercetin dioxygenase-like cupin family protein